MLWNVAAVSVLACLLPAALSRPADLNTQASRGEESGAQLFRIYCASCHGVTGHGDGPVAGEFRKIPPDLTKYSARNGGIFPSERVRQIVDGRGVRAHGNREMPVWGDAFASRRGGLSVEDATARIDAIVAYLKTIQEGRAQ